MQWNKSKITRWNADGFRITEDPELGERCFRLDSPFGAPAFFFTLEDAKSSATLQNDLALARDELARLRGQLGARPNPWQDQPPVEELATLPAPPAEPTVPSGPTVAVTRQGQILVDFKPKPKPATPDERGIPSTPHARDSALHIHAGELQEYPF